MNPRLTTVLTRTDCPDSPLLFGPTPSPAADAVIAKQSEPQAIDPHSRDRPDRHLAESHLFDRLIQANDKEAMAPGLAVSWKQIDDLTLKLSLSAPG